VPGATLRADGVRSIHVVPGGVVVVAVSTSGAYSAFRSSDGGRTFGDAVPLTGPTSFNESAVAVLADGTIVLLNASPGRLAISRLARAAAKPQVSELALPNERDSLAACRAETTHWALVDRSLAVSTDDGVTWKPVAVVDIATSLASLSCTATQVAVHSSLKEVAVQLCTRDACGKPLDVPQRQERVFVRFTPSPELWTITERSKRKPWAVLVDSVEKDRLEIVRATLFPASGHGELPVIRHRNQFVGVRATGNRY
jgi:hypothetical protein